MAIKKMYQVATTAHREGKGKAPASVKEIREEETSAGLEDDDNDVAAFNWQGARPKTNQPSSQGNRGYSANWGNYQTRSGINKRGGSSGGNNTNQNNKYCYFCKQQGNRREKCQKRIKQNKPCWDAQGWTYWPRNYFMDENQDFISVNATDFPEDEILDVEEEHRFDIARVNFNKWECKQSTAAHPQFKQNMGFQ